MRKRRSKGLVPSRLLTRRASVPEVREHGVTGYIVESEMLTATAMGVFGVLSRISPWGDKVS
jgi:hypothetical protein